MWDLIKEQKNLIHTANVIVVFTLMTSCHVVQSFITRGSWDINRKQTKSDKKDFNSDVKGKIPELWKIRADDAIFPILGNHTNGVALTHVAFSTEKPKLPPTVEPFSTASLSDIDFSKRGHNSRKYGKSTKLGRRHRHGHKKGERRNRRRRSHRQVQYGSPVSACTSISDWVQISESTNMWGHRVTVLPYIEVAGNRVDQYIYETVCVNAGSPCLGTDHRRFRSECVTKKIYTYAYIRNASGEEDWSLIEISGSCNCKLQRKHRSGPRSLLDHLADS